ncbi:unnamed protein product [Adineta steineri]|uniref:Uncharacterized protein n=1 Tax=Adineta steineri TaxID=433720 RepID=A0A815IRT9_9BILA|nr:unnamed protein product [Adineta steineri]CAF4203161.1 unnamed protein product [Adineta steineri]
MTSMAIFQVINLLIFAFPYAILQAYSFATMNLNKSAFRQAQEQFALSFLNIFLSGLYADSFYCYCAASKRYRVQVLDAVKNMFGCGNQTKNRVRPAGETMNMTITLQQRMASVQ